MRCIFEVVRSCYCVWPNETFRRCCRYDGGSASSTLAATLHEFFPTELAQWLLKEMEQNRDRSIESRKVRHQKG